MSMNSTEAQTWLRKNYPFQAKYSFEKHPFEAMLIFENKVKPVQHLFQKKANSPID